jgi:hypothetical protein
MQKESHVIIGQDLQDRLVRVSEFVLKITTRDEMWLYGHNPETRQHSPEGKSPITPCPKNARHVT